MTERTRLTASRVLLVLSLAAVLAVATVLRFYNIPSQGFMHWDEGLHAMEGQFLADTWLRVLGLDPDRVPGGRPPVFVRPAHSLLVSLGVIAGGTTSGATEAVSAVSGVLTVVAVFLLGRSLYSARTGLLAAAFLAAMPLHVVYSRQALSEANGALLFSLSVLLYWHGSGPRAAHGRETAANLRKPGPRGYRWLALAGVFLGLAVATNYRLYIMAVLFPLAELAGWSRERSEGRQPHLRRSLTVAYAALLPVAAFLVLLWWLKAYYAGTGLELRYPVVTYEEQFLMFWQLVNSYPRPLFGQLDLLYYPFALWTFVGAVVTMLLLPSLLALLRDRKKIPQDVLLALWLLIPVVFYSLLSDKAPRCLAAALPAIALLVARALVIAMSAMHPGVRASWQGVTAAVAAALTVTILWQGWVGSWAVANQVGGFGPATAFVTELGADRVIAGQVPPVVVYSGGRLRVSDIPESAEELEGLYREGYRYAMIDDQAYLVPEHRVLAGRLERSSRPILSLPDTLKQGPLLEMEHSEYLKLDLASTLALHGEIRATRGNSEVRVYDLAQYFDH